MYKCRAVRRRVEDRAMAAAAGTAGRGSGRRRNTPWHPFAAESVQETRTPTGTQQD